MDIKFKCKINKHHKVYMSDEECIKNGLKLDFRFRAWKCKECGLEYLGVSEEKKKRSN